MHALFTGMAYARGQARRGQDDDGADVLLDGRADRGACQRLGDVLGGGEDAHLVEVGRREEGLLGLDADAVHHLDRLERVLA